jgi:hypothetical protein
MHELLSRTVDPIPPPEGRQWYRLELFKEDNPLGVRHCVRQTHAQGSGLNRDILWDGEEVDRYWILGMAKRRYAERRAALVARGFCYSDIEI